MKRKRHLMIIAIFLIAISLCATIFIENDLVTKIFNAITVVTAVTGAVALFFQFKKDKQINETEFIFNFSASFYDQYNCSDLVPLLDDYADKKIDSVDYENNTGAIVRYMQ